VIEKSLASQRRTVRVDEPLLEELCELAGIAYWELSTAFLGFPAEEKNAAIEVIREAIDTHPEGGPEEWGAYIRQWAKENERGMYHPVMLDAPELTYETNDHLRNIGWL